MSREAFPKPLLKLVDGQSLLQKTFLRAAHVAHATEIVIVTNRDTYFLARDECADAHAQTTPQVGFILEPAGRNTAAAISAAAQVVRERHGGDAVMLVMPADQLIDDEAAFGRAIEHASSSAQLGRLVTFGIKPTAAETGYGYIEYASAPQPDSQAVHKVTRFIEKPPLDVAERLVADGHHLWNGGMFCFSADAILAELQQYAPQVNEPVAGALRDAKQSVSEDGYAIELDAKSFLKAENISIDYAVMERSDNVNVVPCDMGWNDIGSWLSISELTPPDDHGNRVQGHAELCDVDNCFVRGDARMIGMVGVHDLIVVDTPDALLLAARERAQDVKQIVANLKRANHATCRLHNTVHRPWGTYTILEEGDRFKMKRIVVKPGAALSLQMHHHRSEHWIVVRGCADVINGAQTISLQPNESTYIPAGHRHRLVNPGVVDLVLIEVQCGDYLGEDDIVRFDDAYGRVEAV